MEKIILIGIPNCGKTTLGRRVADKLQLPFFDTDEMVTEKLKPSQTYRLFCSSFNRQFIIEQYNAVKKLAEHSGPAIISTGAEAALQPDCSEILRKLGKIILIQRNPEILLADLLKNPRGPVLREINRGTEINMQAEAVKLYEKEYSKYEALADLTFENNGSEDEGVDGLVALVHTLVGF